jgi:large subunit ribosomal protein L3
MKAILAKKLGMTTVFQDDGTAVPVTVLQAGPCTVTFVRPLDGGRTNVQLGFGTVKDKHTTKQRKGHLKDLPQMRTLKEFRLPKEAESPARGTAVDVSSFAVGDVVQVTGVSKGKGFQGVVRRHHFGGGPASHGHKHNLRAPGSIGSRFPQQTRKGRRMAGRMGGAQVTTIGLKVIDLVPEEHLLVLKGAVPGARGTLLAIEERSR